MHIDVVLRPCARRGLYQEGGLPATPGLEAIAGLGGVTAEEALPRCLSSLILALVRAMDESIVGSASLHVLDPGYPPELRTALTRLLARCPFPTFMPSAHDDSPPHGGSAMSLNPYHYAMRCFSEPAATTSVDSAASLLYFVEADCLHGADSMKELIREYFALSAILGQDIVATPLDEPGLYRAPVESLLLARPERYWRTVPITTRSILLLRRTFWRFCEIFDHDGASAAVDDRSPLKPLAHLYRIIPAVAPMPALAISMLHDESPPFIDGQGWWQYAEPDFSRESSR
jgi:hypothetical protein